MSKLTNLVTFDFETDAIEQRPKYPPKPCGVSIKYRGKAARYFAFGHPTENNCTKAQAVAALKDAYKSGLPLLGQNLKFDVDVAEEHFGLPIPSWERLHDSLYLLFLHNPHARSLSLKPAAEELLGMKPEERDAVFDWLVEHGFLLKSQWKKAGAFISKAPGKLVAPYANGDCVRTEKLFDFLMPKIVEAGMLGAYDRERRLMPILLANERAGMRVDTAGLERDLKVYKVAQAKADAWLRKRLKTPLLNIDSDVELADALEKNKVVTRWIRTPTGKRSTAKKNMTVDLFDDKKVFTALGYRGRIGTCMSMFMESWLSMATSNKGMIFTNWNQVRQTHGDEGNVGARTGRLSCSPNFMNVPKDWYDKNDGYEHPKFLGVLELPFMRKYILPDKGEMIGHRDFSQQEPRILAHFENDKLCAQYNQDPTTDVHSYVNEQIRLLTGLVLSRRAAKTTILGMIYGMGLGTLALRLGVDVEMAKKVRNAMYTAVPGLRVVEQETKMRGKMGQPVKTWGGRLYYVEEPKLINGRMCTFEYKLLNFLIQGSAADCTKESIIRYDTLKKSSRFMVTVHDEINISAPKSTIKSEMLLLREAMEGVDFDVPMLTDAKMGPHWAALEKLKEIPRVLA